jgi:hypothetical protein
MTVPEEYHFANVLWQKRFNTVGEASYVSDLTPRRVHAVCVLGSVTIDREDVGYLVGSLRAFCDSLERFVAEQPAPPPVPARREPGPRGRRRRRS